VRGIASVAAARETIGFSTGEGVTTGKPRDMLAQAGVTSHDNVDAPEFYSGEGVTARQVADVRSARLHAGYMMRIERG
jgi:hypothetical protein